MRDTDLRVYSKGTAVKERRWWGEQLQQQRERASYHPQPRFWKIVFALFFKRGFKERESFRMSDPSHWSAVPSQNKPHFVPGTLLKRSKRYFPQEFVANAEVDAI